MSFNIESIRRKTKSWRLSLKVTTCLSWFFFVINKLYSRSYL